jgi:tetratricopeptide (TPR) repeat protein
MSAPGSSRAAAALAVALALAAGGAGAQPPPAGHPPAARAAALEALERWDLPAAQQALAAVAASPDPAVSLLRSRAAFFAGDYGAAARLVDALPPDVAATGDVAGWSRLVAATLALDRRLAVRESAHFVLRYEEAGDWVLAGPALEALEAAHAALGDWLDVRPGEKVRVEIAPTAPDFEQVSGLERREIETAGAVGVCIFNKIVVLTPRALLRGYPWRDTLVHEFAHFLVVRASANRAPIWLQEGVARLAETRWRGPAAEPLDELDRALLARVLREGGLIPFAAMDPSLVRLPSTGAVRLAFAECASAADYLLAGWKTAGLRALLDALARQAPGAGADAALRASLGVPLAEFEAGWRGALAGRGYEEIPGVVTPPYRLAGEGEAEAWDLAEWQPLASQNHLRLGDLLRARGRQSAALVEYARAVAAAPGSPFARVRQARALLALGRAAEAAESARAATRLADAYPAAHEVLAAALAALGDTAGAAAALQASLEVNPFNPFAWRDLARALGKLGQADQARLAGVAALRLGPADEGFQRSIMQNP